MSQLPTVHKVLSRVDLHGRGHAENPSARCVERTPSRVLWFSITYLCHGFRTSSAARIFTSAPSWPLAMPSKGKASKASVMLQAVTASTLPPRTAAVATAPKRPQTEASEPLSKSAAKRAKQARVAAAMPAETKKQQVSLKDCDAELFGGPAVVRPKYAHAEEVSEEEASAFVAKHEIAISTTGDAAARPC